MGLYCVGYDTVVSQPTGCYELGQCMKELEISMEMQEREKVCTRSAKEGKEG